MNAHLNVFKTYTRENRNYQLENDLTRSLAICLQEDALFFHEVLKVILNDEREFDLIFSNPNSINDVVIDIQINTSTITDFDKIYAVSLSDFEMLEDHFWNQKNQYKYDPICDIVIRVKGIVIVIEAKRDYNDCTNQLYNQIFNILDSNSLQQEFTNIVKPVDLNWKKIMAVANKVLAFEKAVDNLNRFTSDFTNLVKGHNPHWLPEVSIAALNCNDRLGIQRRIESAINVLDTQNIYRKLSNRLGLVFENTLWAQEILFHVSENGELIITVYAGNTKAQGRHIFSGDLKISNTLDFDSLNLIINQRYHIKLTSFQKYFTGLWITDEVLKKDGLYSKENFENYTGRNYRSSGHWDDIEQLFDEYMTNDYDWRHEISWEQKVITSNKSQFDLSFGYEFYVIIPFEELKKRDKNPASLDGLTELIKSSYKAFEDGLII